MPAEQQRLMRHIAIDPDVLVQRLLETRADAMDTVIIVPTNALIINRPILERDVEQWSPHVAS
jgi:hypothetical protein